MSQEVSLPPEDLARLREALAFPSERPTDQTEGRRSRMPARRTLVGGLLALIAAVILVRSFVYTTGYDTTLVADLGYVRAPFTGIVREMTADVGDRVSRDQTVGTFAAQVGMTAAVRAASEDEQQLNARIASIDARMATLSRMAARIRSEAITYRSSTADRMRASAAGAEAETSAAETRLAFAERQFARSTALAERGFVSNAGLEKAQEERDTARAERAGAQARRRGGEIDLRAAAQGMLLGSGYSDVQYSTQRLSDLTLALSQMQGERDVLATALATQRGLSAGKTDSFKRQVRLSLHASIAGRVWSKAAAVGEMVREGEPIFVLADCTSFFAYFTVGRSTYSGLSVGEKVTFISSTDGEHWPGLVVNLGVNDPGLLRVTSQIERPPAGRYLIGARIQLPPEAQRACPVGSPGRIVLGAE